MPRPPNTGDEDPEVALVVNKLTESKRDVARIEKERQVASAVFEAFAAGISWPRIAEYVGYGSAQAAQQDVMSETTLTRRSGN